MFYGEIKVKEINGEEVTLENGRVLTLTKKEQELVLSEEERDATKFMVGKVGEMTKLIFELLKEYRHILNKRDFQILGDNINASLTNYYNIAVSKKFNNYDQEELYKYGPEKLIDEISYDEILKGSDIKE